MKPTQIIEKTTTPTDSLQTEVRGKTLNQKMVYMVIGVVTFVLVVGAVLLSVYFGRKMTQDSFKEYQATFVDNGSVTHEEIIVTDTEEVFITNMATGIADFSKGPLTIKLKSEFPADKCYVTNMNFSDFQTPKEFTSAHASTQITFETKHNATRTFDVTDIWLNHKTLGPRSSELCNGQTVYFLQEKTDQTTRDKRSSCVNYQCLIQHSRPCGPPNRPSPANGPPDGHPHAHGPLNRLCPAGVLCICDTYGDMQSK